MAPHEGDFKGQVPPKRMRPMLGHPPLSMVRNRGPPVSPIGRCWSVRTKLKAKRHNPHASTGRRNWGGGSTPGARWIAGDEKVKRNDVRMTKKQEHEAEGTMYMMSQHTKTKTAVVPTQNSPQVPVLPYTVRSTL